MTRRRVRKLRVCAAAPRAPARRRRRLALGELLADPLAEGEYERVLEAIEVQELVSLLSGLSERERAILRLRYGLDTGQEETLREIAGRLGLSAERVRQLEERALGKLAVAAAAKGDAA